MELEPLGDIFGPQGGSSSRGGVPLQDVEFDPDRDFTEKRDVEQPSTGSLVKPRHQAQHQSQPQPKESVDPGELKRRIQGVGSEAPSLLQRARQAAVAKCGQGRERCAEKIAESPQRFLLAGAAVCMVLVFGIAYYVRAASSLQPSETVLRDRGQASRRTGRGSEKEDEPDEDSTDGAGEAKDTADGGGDGDRKAPPASGQAASAEAKHLAKELAALRRSVAEGDRGIREELRALRQELAQLGSRGRSSSSDAGDAQAQPEGKRPKAGTGLGEVRQEAGGRTRSRPAASQEEPDAGEAGDEDTSRQAPSTQERRSGSASRADDEDAPVQAFSQGQSGGRSVGEIHIR